MRCSRCWFDAKWINEVTSGAGNRDRVYRNAASTAAGKPCRGVDVDPVPHQ